MKGKDSRGFTLIEVIIAIVLFSIMTVMILLFTGANIYQSVNPVINLIRAGDVQTGMDNVTRAYYNLSSPVSQPALVNFYNTLTTPAQAAIVINTAGVTVDTSASKTGFITFPVAGGNEVNYGATATPNLKVTLTNSLGQRVSTIFTARW